MTFKKIICLFACFFLTACCLTRINHQPASLIEQKNVNQFQLDGDESRVHFFPGDMYVFDSIIKLNQVAELYINNLKAGTLGNSKEYIAVDLHPGTYDFKWMPIGLDAQYTQPEPLRLTIEKEELIFLKANFRDESPAAAMMFGVIGALVGLKFQSFFEQDTSLRNNIHEYQLISLNENMKNTLSIKNRKLDQSNTERAASNDLERKLSKLKIIYEKGLITKEEYDIKRKELIGEF